MIRVEEDSVEVEGTIVQLMADGAKMLSHLYLISAEELGPEAAEEYVLNRIPKMVKESIQRK
jgi:hypothetical protein